MELSSCKKPVAGVGEISNDFLEECIVDEDDDWQSRIYEFVSTPSYVSLLLCNASDPVYFMLKEKNGQATEKLQDWCGHVVLSVCSFLLTFSLFILKISINETSCKNITSF